MKFTKMHGAGNDFIILNNMLEGIAEREMAALAKRLCNRRTSLGADGLIFVCKAAGAEDYAMRFYNADGSLGEMCGNGARCICRYGFEHGLSTERQSIETSAGTVRGERISKTMYRIRLNKPSLIETKIPLSLDGQSYDAAYIELGNPGLPHCIVRMDDWDERDIDELRRLGRALRYYEGFPKGANVSFTRLLDRRHIKAITFERGVEDFTLACGTGCGSAVSVFALRGDTDRENISVSVPGGELLVSVEIAEGDVNALYLTGPTCTVAEGELVEY